MRLITLAALAIGAISAVHLDEKIIKKESSDKFVGRHGKHGRHGRRGGNYRSHSNELFKKEKKFDFNLEKFELKKNDLHKRHNNERNYGRRHHNKRSDSDSCSESYSKSYSHDDHRKNFNRFDKDQKEIKVLKVGDAQ